MPSLGSRRYYLLSFLEMQQISSGQRGRHYLRNFVEMRRTTCRKKFQNGAQKKVSESAGLVGTSRPRLGSPGHTLAQTRFPSRAQNIKNGPKWVQNRRFRLKIGPCESYGHFGPVRTGPGPKKSKSMPQNRQDLDYPEHHGFFYVVNHRIAYAKVSQFLLWPAAIPTPVGDHLMLLLIKRATVFCECSADANP